MDAWSIWRACGIPIPADTSTTVYPVPNNADANRAVRQSHEAIFQEWVGYSLEHKKADLDLYITTIEEVDKTQLIDAWLRLTPYKNLVPASIQGPERQTHLRLRGLLGLLKWYGVPCPYLDEKLN